MNKSAKSRFKVIRTKPKHENFWFIWDTDPNGISLQYNQDLDVIIYKNGQYHSSSGSVRDERYKSFKDAKRRTLLYYHRLCMFSYNNNYF